MPLTPETLHQCLWALPNKKAETSLRHWRKGGPPAPAVRALFAKREHNFVPVFCLPADNRLPLLRSRLALPRQSTEILHLPSVQVQLSACTPVAVYGQATLQLSAQGYAYDFLKLPQVGVVTAPELLEVAQAVHAFLHTSGIELLTQAEVAQPLPEDARDWNRKTFLDALFIKDDYPY